MVSKLTESSVLEKAARLCLKNARQYIKDADMLCSFKSYGHALALTVLSDVELGKAVIYHLWSRDLISGDTLPPPFQSHFWDRQYGLFASETWWVGLSIASNIEGLVQDLLDASEEAGETVSKGEKLPAPAIRRITEIIERMRKENDKLMELEDYRTKGFFVAFSLHDASISTPDLVENTLVKDQIQIAKHRIRISTPFLSLSFSATPKKITRLLLGEAFQSVLPLRDRILQFVLQVENHVEELVPTSGVFKEDKDRI